MSFWTLKKKKEEEEIEEEEEEEKHSILLITESYPKSFLFKQLKLIAFFVFVFLLLLFSLSVHTLIIEYNVCLSVAPTHLKELLNMVYHKGHSCDLYSSASMLMIYLCIYHQIMQNVICSRMTQHFIQQEKAL